MLAHDEIHAGADDEVKTAVHDSKEDRLKLDKRANWSSDYLRTVEPTRNPVLMQFPDANRYESHEAPHRRHQNDNIGTHWRTFPCNFPRRYLDLLQFVDQNEQPERDADAQQGEMYNNHALHVDIRDTNHLPNQI